MKSLKLEYENLQNIFSIEFGKNLFIAKLFLISLLLILIFEKNRKNRRLFGLFGVLWLFIYANPIFKLLVSKISPGSSYSSYLYYIRFSSALPFVIYISYGFTLVIKCIKKINIPLIILFSVLIILLGKDITIESRLAPKNNLGGINSMIYDISENEEIKKNKYSRVLVPKSIVIDIKQINPNILLVYPGEITNNKIYEEIDSDEADIDFIMDFVNKSYCDYFMVKNSDDNNKCINSVTNLKVVGVVGDYLVCNNNQYKISYDDLGRICNIKYNDGKELQIIRNKEYEIVEENLFKGAKKETYIKQYDNNQKLQQIDYYVNGVLSENSKGYSTIKYENSGKRISYYNSKGILTNCVDGYSTIENNCYYNKDGKLVFKTITDKDDIYYRIISVCYYDEYGNPYEVNGYCTSEYQYYNSDLIIKQINSNTEVVNSFYALNAPKYLTEIEFLNQGQYIEINTK